MVEFEGIVIRVTPFRDKDAIVNVISKDKLRSFLARGVLKLESKNAPSVNMFVKSRFQVSKGKEGFSLRVGELLNSYEKIKTNLNALAVMDFVGELTNKMIQADEVESLYPFFEKTIVLLNSGFDPLSAAILYFARILLGTGYGLDVDNCVSCGKTSQIVSFSFKDGGFICADCFNPLKHEKLNSRQLKIWRYIFKVDLANYGKVSFEKQETLKVLNELAEFVTDVAQVELKSLKLLRKL